MLMSAADYRESLRRYRPRVFVNGGGSRASPTSRCSRRASPRVGVTYDFALEARARGPDDGPPGHVGQDRQPHAAHRRDLDRPPLQARGRAARLPGVRLRRSATSRHDALNGIFQATKRTDDAHGTDYHQRFLAYLHEVQDEDLTLGVAMTDAKGDRSKRPGEQANPRRLRAHQGAPPGRHRHPRHQGHRHRRALHARVPGHALPHHDAGGRGLRRLLRRAGRCRRASPSWRARRAARRGGGEVLGASTASPPAS